MKLIGFIKEYNNIEEAKYLQDMLNSKSLMANEIKKILNYLNQGVVLFAWMTYFFEVKSKKPLTPAAYITDGVFLWPTYFPYYIEKYPFIEIDKEFLAYLEGKNYNFVIDVNYERLKHSYQKEFSKRL